MSKRSVPVDQKSGTGPRKKSDDKYPTPPGLRPSTLLQSPEEAEALSAAHRTFQERQKKRAADLRRQARRRSIRSVSGGITLGGLTNLVREHEGHERALIDYACGQFINLSDPQWRTTALERLARSHPALKPKRPVGAPRKGPDPKRGTIEELVKLPAPYSPMPIGQFLEQVEQIKEATADTSKPKRSRKTYTNVAVYLTDMFGLPLSEQGRKSKQQHWQNTIAYARSRMRKIKNNSQNLF